MNKLVCASIVLSALLIIGCPNINQPSDENGGTPTPGLIGETGGEFTAESGATITVPDGALHEPVQLSVTTHRDADSMSDTCGVAAIYDGIELGPHGTVFDSPITVTWPISDDRYIPGRTYALIYYDDVEGLWIDEGFLGSVSEDGAYFTCSLTHFSAFSGYEGPTENLGDYFNEDTSPEVALGHLVADFLAKSDLMAFRTDADGKKYVVAKITFDLQYHIDGEEGQVILVYPVNAPATSDDNIMKIQYGEDRLSNLGVQNVKELLITLHFEEVPEPYRPAATRYTIQYNGLYMATTNIEVLIYFNTNMDKETTEAACVSPGTYPAELNGSYVRWFDWFGGDDHPNDNNAQYSITVRKGAFDSNRLLPLLRDYEVTFVPNEVKAAGTIEGTFDNE